jgi:hypothetical protein
VSDEIPPDSPHPEVSRRALLKGVTLGAGAALVAPTVLTLAATPAAASPAGCNACGQNMMIGTTTPGTGQNFGDGTVAALAGWTAVSNISSVGGVFRGTGASFAPGTAVFTRTFSPECQARFGTQELVSFFLAGTLLPGTLLGGSTASTVQLVFLDSSNAQIGTPFTISSAGPALLPGFVPTTAASFRLTMTLPRRDGFLDGVSGRADDIVVQLAVC